MEVDGIRGGRTRSSSHRVELSNQKRQRTRSETRGAPAAETAAAGKAAAERASTPLVRKFRKKPRVLKILEKHNMKLLEEQNGGLGGCDPYHVANNVSQEELREFYEHSSICWVPIRFRRRRMV
jgi:hypothetical protein